MIETKRFACEIYGQYALFSEPLTRSCGEKYTYDVPTYSALVGILKSIYWKPTFEYVIDKVRIMNEIRTQNVGVLGIRYSSKKDEKDVFNYTKLYDVRYQVLFHIEWNLNHPELKSDRCVQKHQSIIQRCIEKGGRRDIFLGTRECQGYAVPCVFGSDVGYYDSVENYRIGTMFHSFTYPDTAFDDKTKGMLTSNFWTNVVMKNGIIEFIRPEDCIHKYIRPIKNGIKTYQGKVNIILTEGETI